MRKITIILLAVNNLVLGGAVILTNSRVTDVVDDLARAVTRLGSAINLTYAVAYQNDQTLRMVISLFIPGG